MGYYCEKEGNYVKKRSFDDKGSHFPIFAYDTSKFFFNKEFSYFFNQFLIKKIIYKKNLNI